jgi:HAD superfamily hydrolase (TIGR01450 family)
MTDPKAYVFDIDGVLKTTEKGALPHAQATLDALTEKGIPFRLMTNCPFLDPVDMDEKMKEWGLNVNPNLLYGSAHPLKEYLKRHPLRTNKVWSIGLEAPGPYLEALGLLIDNNLSGKDLGALILFDDDFWWDTEKIAVVFNLLLEDPKLPLIIPNPDLIFPDRPGHFMLTSGSIGELLKTLCEAKGRKLDPVYLGKPYLPLFRMTEEALRKEVEALRPEEIVMIGDTPATDIMGANSAGWQTWLVKTGGYRYGENFEGAKPDHVFDDLFPILQKFR